MMFQQPQTTTNHTPGTHHPSLAERLENARCRVTSALRAADEGEVSVSTFDAISRDLVAATSDLSYLAAELGTHMSAERRVS